MDKLNGHYRNDPHVDLTYIETHPFGMTAANDKLYVAAEGTMHIYNLVRSADNLPKGGVYSLPETWCGSVTVEGWARDPHGIKQVTLRLGDEFQFFVDDWFIDDLHCGRHCRPVTLNRYWHMDIDVSGIPTGTYELKVIVENIEGDFSVVHQETVILESVP